MSDLLPTILECVGVDAPDNYRGVPQQPVEGTSLRYTFDAAEEPTRKVTQYYEMLGDRGIWHDGWKAVTRHERGTPFADDAWALYHTDVDFSECVDLAEQEPEKLRELVDRWWVEAGKYNVLPLDDRRGGELMIIRRPGHEPPGDVQRILPATPHLERSKTPDIRNRSFEIRARVSRVSGDEGVLVACGARTSGYTFYVQDDHLVFLYNRLGHLFEVRSTEVLPAGELDLVVDYRKSDEHRGTAELFVAAVDGPRRSLGAGPVETLPYRQTLYGMDVGKDAGPTVSDAYAGPFAYGGTLHWVEFQLGGDRHDLVKAADVELENQLADQ